MATLIEQIQREVVNNDVPLASLLRKVKLAAFKLGLGEFEKWVELELQGYDDDVPNYRNVVGTPMAFDSYGKWIPIVGGLAAQIQHRSVGQGVAALEDVIKRSEGKRGGLEMPFSHESAEIIDKHLAKKFRRYSLHIDRSTLIDILDRVRGLVLDLTIDLEKSGVQGSDFSFSDADKEKAQHMGSPINIGSIGSIVGNLGSGNTTGNITVGNVDVRAATALGEQIRGYLPMLEREGVDIVQVQPHLDRIAAQANQATPSQSVVRGALTDIRNALSGATGSLLASGIIEGIGRLLG